MGGIVDSLDLKIISHLQKEGRISITELAEKIGSSRPTITNRLRRLLEEDIVKVRSGLNLSKLGFKMACLGLDIKDENAWKMMRTVMEGCPRVMSVFRTTEKSNVHLSMWAEDESSLNSTIESFRENPNVEVVYAHYLGTPIQGNAIVNICSGECGNPPCGRDSVECPRYKNGWCRGCPLSSVYKNPLLE
ncbi:MAG TPA: winged helix-turn-helix transcriptional regulator [Patescibacteria group bacterium]|nr:winged helix-turn-helix transcriptional regulator [Patescibacteria group bacterium]